MARTGHNGDGIGVCDKSRSGNVGWVGEWGRGKGVRTRRGWLTKGEGGSNDVARMGSGGVTDGASNESHGSDDERAGNWGKGEGTGSGDDRAGEHEGHRSTDDEGGDRGIVSGAQEP